MEHRQGNLLSFFTALQRMRELIAARTIDAFTASTIIAHMFDIDKEYALDLLLKF